MSRRGGCLTALLLILAAIAGAVGYRQWLDRADPLATGDMIAGFQRMNQLTVFAADVVAVPTTRVPGMVGLLDREQTAIVPARVTYTVDLSRMTERDVVWNPATHVLTLTVPPVRIEPPNMAEEGARYFSKGLPVSARTQQDLTRSNSIKAQRQAVALARAPELVRMAEQSARDAIALNAGLPLRAAQGADAKVVVRFATEGGRSGERIEQSRSLHDVYAR